MKVSTMRELDSIHIAELITRARNNIGQDDALPHMGYMMLPDYKPSYAYKYYNIRSRHFRVQEVFFVAHDDSYNRIDGVISFADIERKTGYLRLMAVEQTLLEGQHGYDMAWFVRQAIAELCRFVTLDAIRLLIAKRGESDEFIGPHVSPGFLQIFEPCGFQQLTRLMREGGRHIHVEIYECPVVSII